MQRKILHIDMNNCYASITVLHHPKLRGHPVAIGGDVESRHGIILARNYEAKPYNINVGQAIWEAKAKCPNLIVVPPEYELYLRFSKMLRDMVAEYTDLIEPFGLDELWADVTNSLKLFNCTEVELAHKIRERVKKEMGVTVSIGVSFNKIFAKLGSDYKKPDAVTVITEDNFKNIVWPLPASDILGVGRSTKKKLDSRCVKTIGDIANLDPKTLQSWFGKWGLILHCFSNGLDSSPVAKAGSENVIKSIGNSWTTPKDLENENDAKIVFYSLAESVAERLREQGLKGRTVQISVRDNKLCCFERQLTLGKPTNLASEICDYAMKLLKDNYNFEKPLRSIGVRAVNLSPECEDLQLTFFDDVVKREKLEKIERTIDKIRHRYGHNAINIALMLSDEKLGKLDATTHTIHPIGYF